MKTCGAALMLLLCCCLAEPEESQLNIADEGGHSETAASTQQTCLPDIHAALREMSALVAEQRVELRHTKTQMEAMENTVEALEVRLRTSESLVERLKGENKAQAVNMNLSVSQVDELRREREERRVSFSASLLASGVGNTGPFSVATPLVYRHVFTNVGNAYNPNTGVFTAPVRGVYHFLLFVWGRGDQSTRSGVSLHKNGEHVVIAYNHHTNSLEEGSASNGASLLLEVGDVVYVKLWPNCWVRDHSNHHHTTFSGHLLFSM